MPTVPELEGAFKVYVDEIERCQRADAYWSLLHVVVALPDICAALESENGWATEKKYVSWCKTYVPTGLLVAEDYRDIRDIVLHQGRTRSRGGRHYKFTKPTVSGHRVHRLVYDSDVVVLDVGELAKEMVSSVQAWFLDLQTPAAQARNDAVARNLPSLVTVKEQELPGISGATFTFNATSTGP